MKTANTFILILLFQNVFAFNPQNQCRTNQLISGSFILKYNISSPLINDGSNNLNIHQISISKPVNKVPKRKFDLVGFSLGFFLGPIGVVIAYLMKGDETKMRNLRRSALIGGVLNLILSIILIILLFNALADGLGNLFSGII